MSLSEDPADEPHRRSRTILVGFLGAVVRKMGNWMPIAGVVELMGRCGVDESSVRTATFRLKQRGWLLAESQGRAKGYRLTERAIAALAEGDEIVWHARQPADLADGWCIVNFSVPEVDRSQRFKLRSHLSSLGFGNISAGVWIAPARMLSAGTAAVAEVGLTDQATIFVGAHAGGRSLQKLVATGWDLDQIAQRYRDFIHSNEMRAASWEAARVIDAERAFADYIDVIDRWRKLPFRDPGLPREVLPDLWPAPEAARVFERLVSVLEGRALGYAATVWPTDGAESQVSGNRRETFRK